MQSGPILNESTASPLEKILIKKEKSKWAVKPVSIQEMLVSFPDQDSALGEFKRMKTGKERSSALHRIVEHANLLAKIANQYHHDRYDKSDASLQLELENKVTRLILNEFALYANQCPLTFNEFSSLLKNLNAIASQCQQNVHLVLGSVGVQEDDGKVFNIGIYIECGKEPIIHTFAKSHSAASDGEYSGFTNFSRVEKEENVDKPVAFVSNHAFPERSLNLNSFFKCQTAGGARFDVAVEICADHVKQHAKILLKKQLELMHREASDYVETQLSQVIISNDVPIEPGSVISCNVTQADALKNTVFSNYARGEKTPLANLNEAKLNSAQYALLGKEFKCDISLDREKSEIQVKGSPFGSDYVIKVYAENNLVYDINSKDEIGASLHRQIERANRDTMVHKINMFKKTNTYNDAPQKLTPSCSK